VAEKTSRRPRLLWTLLGAMALVGLVPLVVSHYFLIGINRDSLETLEKKYLTRSAVSIASDLQNLLTNNRQQLGSIGGGLVAMKKALPAGTDPFEYTAQTGHRRLSLPDGDLIALRALNPRARRAGRARAARRRGPSEMDAARDVAIRGSPTPAASRTWRSSTSPRS
jgi:hypothetical protein